jgi:hypothetical protein
MKTDASITASLVLVPLAISVTGCAEPLPDYIGLKAGAKWEYAAEVRVAADTLTGRNVFEIAAERELIGDKSYFKTTETALGFGDQEPVVRYARKADEGVFEVDGQMSDQPEYMLMPLDLKLDDQWAMMTAAGDSLACRAESIEGVEVPAGRYEESLKIVCSGRRLMSGYEAPAVIVEYRAPGVGLVQAVTEWGDVVITLRLLRHDAGRSNGTDERGS